MIVGFHFLACLGLLVFRTTAISSWIPPALFYDPLIPFAVFLGLRRRLPEGLLVVPAAGFLADGLSAAPFGTFGLVYLLVLLTVRGGAGFFRSDNRLLPAMGTAAGVLLEHLVFLGIAGLPGGGVRHLPELASRLAFAALTGPAVVGFLGLVFGVQERWAAAAKENRDAPA